jgi:glycosyltransferase involved in cell wall biosynthesis
VKTILILVDHFYPAYKGGGPIQSITNLIAALERDYRIYVITSAYDLASKTIMEGVVPNEWGKVILPQSNKTILVWYSEKHSPGYNTLKKLLAEVNPDKIYLNGIFSYNLFMLPLVVIKNIRSGHKVVICPRGMLQKGALADKALKKYLYLKALKFSGLVSKVMWHATNKEEEADVLKQFDNNAQVIIAVNIPKMPAGTINPIKKVPGSLKLVYLSLITEKKNLLFLLELIKNTDNISLDIMGPVKDTLYWNQCYKLINELPDKFNYSGTITPLKVQDKFSEYHASILLTKGENFGHALYESLSAGRPVITSNFTPWNNLEEKKAGWNLNINNFSECIAQLNKIKDIDQLKYASFCTGAYQIAKEYYSQSIDLSNYKKIFE